MSASTSQLRPISPEIERCYLALRGRHGGRTTRVHSAGHLAVVLANAKHGTLDRPSVKTPGIASRVGKQIESCIRETVAGQDVPEATKDRGCHRAVLLPAQRSAPPHAGPQFSWFDVVGCHSKK